MIHSIRQVSNYAYVVVAFISFERLVSVIIHETYVYYKSLRNLLQQCYAYVYPPEKANF